MRFTNTPMRGAVIIDIDARVDERGLFARTFCGEEFKKAGLPAQFVQCNTSWNAKVNTLRGLHFQKDPYAEGKLVRCTHGSIYDVIVDLRADSSTFKHWFGIELSSENRRSLYVPPGFAHGFMTLKDDTEVFYQMTESYHPEAAAGVRWNDPAFAITWPNTSPLLSPRDAGYADFNVALLGT